MVEFIRKILAKRGLLYFTTRFGNSLIRRIAFDEYYRTGKWDYFNNTHSEELIAIVEKYSNRGRILDMGCGPGIVVSLLNPDSFSFYQGVDASTEAITLATKKRQNTKAEFILGDIQTYESSDRFDVILFEESLYYVAISRLQVLRRYTTYLENNGVIIATTSDPKRYSKMLTMIRDHFTVIEDRPFTNSNRHFIVFR
jgi:2-polyprenyl-3-methyl-5-hydroxy-6-metoxy-1,4-benzoquinol methylase